MGNGWRGTSRAPALETNDWRIHNELLVVGYHPRSNHISDDVYESLPSTNYGCKLISLISSQRSSVIKPRVVAFCRMETVHSCWSVVFGDNRDRSNPQPSFQRVTLVPTGFPHHDDMETGYRMGMARAIGVWSCWSNPSWGIASIQKHLTWKFFSVNPRGVPTGCPSPGGTFGGLPGVRGRCQLQRSTRRFDPLGRGVLVPRPLGRNRGSDKAGVRIKLGTLPAMHLSELQA